MRGMTKEETGYAVIKNAIRVLCVMCAVGEDRVVDLLTGHLWDQEEADGIKRSDGRFHVVMPEGE